ncbi:MAG: 50S ribosomal protein L29 [Victivallaceae bacterium]
MKERKKDRMSLIGGLRELDAIALNDKLLSLKKELFLLRADKAMNRQVKVHRFGAIRKEIAQVMTVKSEKMRCYG